MNDEVYFNFPIWLLREAFTDMRGVCQNIMDYAIYSHSQKLNGSMDQCIKAAAEYFDITLGNAKRTASNGQRLSFMTSKKPVMTGLSKHSTFDFYDNNKTDLEKAALLAFLAIKSIVGQKSYCKITNDFLFCRMAGYGKKDEVTVLSDELKKYKTRWYIDRLRTELKNKYGLKIYGRYTRGFYVSFKLSEDDLIRAVEINRKKYIEKTQKEGQSKAVERVLMKLYPRPEH